MGETVTTGALRPLDIGIGVGAAAWYALPDVVQTRWARGLIKTGVVLGAAGVVAARADAKGADSLVAGLEPSQLVGADPVAARSLLAGTDRDPDGPAQVSAGRAGVVVAAASLASLASAVLADRAMAWTAGWLRGRGVRRPYGVMALGIGVGTVLSRPSRRLAP